MGQTLTYRVLAFNTGTQLPHLDFVDAEGRED